MTPGDDRVRDHVDDRTDRPGSHSHRGDLDDPPRPARVAASLAAGTAANGLLAYAFFALVTRGLGAETAAPVAVLWTYWGACTAFITFPLQHWLIRTMRANGEAAVRAGVRRLLRPVAVLAVGASLLSWWGVEQLFSTTGPVFPSLVGLVTLGTFLTGLVRGGLVGRERFTATSVALAADNLLRVLGAVVVLRVGGGAAAMGVVLGLGAAIGLAWPSAIRFRAGPTGPSRPEELLGPLAVGSALAQLVLVGGPVAVALLDGPPEHVTTLFVTMALFRAPYLLGLGLANQATGPLTGWTLSGATHLLRRYHLLTATATTVGAAAAAPFGMAAGPPLVALVFGAEVRPDPVVAAVVAAGSVVAVGTLALSLVAIGEGRGLRITHAWLAACMVASVVLLATPVPPVLTVAVAFLTAETIAFATLLWGGWRNIGRGTPGNQRSGCAR